MDSKLLLIFAIVQILFVVSFNALDLKPAYHECKNALVDFQGACKDITGFNRTVKGHFSISDFKIVKTLFNTLTPLKVGTRKVDVLKNLKRVIRTKSEDGVECKTEEKVEISTTTTKQTTTKPTTTTTTATTSTAQKTTVTTQSTSSIQETTTTMKVLPVQQTTLTPTKITATTTTPALVAYIFDQKSRAPDQPISPAKIVGIVLIVLFSLVIVVLLLMYCLVQRRKKRNRTRKEKPVPDSAKDSSSISDRTAGGRYQCLTPRSLMKSIKSDIKPSREFRQNTKKVRSGHHLPKDSTVSGTQMLQTTVRSEKDISKKGLKRKITLPASENLTEEHYVLLKVKNA